MKESLNAELPLFAELVMLAMSRVMEACLRNDRSRRKLRSWLGPLLRLLVLTVVSFSLDFFPFWAFFIFFDALPGNRLKLLILYAMPITQSLLRASFICTLVMLRLSTLVVRYSSLQVMLFCSVTSMPSSGANDSLMLTVLILYIELGMGLPVVASVMNPSPFIYSWNVL